jgi:Flp pilus assembly protein TadD
MDRATAIAGVQQAGQQALAQIRAGRYEQALGWCVRGLTLAPKHPGLNFLAGVSHNAAGRPEAALGCFAKTLSEQPNHLDALYNAGHALERLGRFEEAIAHYRRALAVKPGHLPSRFNLANCLVALDTDDTRGEARALLEQILNQQGEPRAHKNLGVIALSENRLSDAQYHFARVLNAFPDFSEAAGNLGFTLLKQEQFAEGWQYLEQGSATKEAEYRERRPALPLWDFSTGQRVLLWVEQGIGDTLMFGSVLPEIIAASEAVGLACDPRLHPLLAATFGEGLALFRIAGPDTLDGWAVQRSLESSMAGYRRSAADFAATAQGYITADGARAENLRAALGVGEEQTLIGISWHSVASETGASRSCALNELLAAAAGDDRVFVNLQYGDVSDELAQARDAGFNIIEAPDLDTREDLDGLATLVAACDLVITIDNSTVHLGGALGQNQILLLPYYCDWRWGLERQTSLLYANTQLVRQPGPGDWASVFAQLKASLAGL